MEFKLLGAFEARVGAQPVSIGSPKHRILLATLLLENGRMVSSTDLIDAVWGAAWPDNPRRALHVCITRTRALLGSADPSPIVTGPDGYRIEVADDMLDVRHFRRCLERADVAAVRGDAEGEWKALSEALDLWRGDVLADVPSDKLHRDHGQLLTELRLQAVERRVDLSLRIDRQAEVVGELATLASRHPLRERMWAQLMTALNRSGRRADALMAFHTVRQLLADELGIDPGDELQRLYLTVLRGDLPVGGGQPEVPYVPRQLPSEVPGFAGRTAQLDRMRMVLEEHERASGGGPTVLIVNGMPGVGKTALAAHWSRSVADRFPDGQLWLDLRGHLREPLTPHRALAQVLLALRVPRTDVPPDLDSRVSLFRSLVDGRRLLFVLDNAASAEQVRPLLPGGAGSFVLVTSRNELSSVVAAVAALTLRLDVLSNEEARQMLRARIGGTRVDAEPHAADGIVDRCGGLPLALAVAAARAVARPTFTLTALAQQLADAGQLDGFRNPDAAIDVRTAFNSSYEALTPPAARLFRMLGFHPTTELSMPAAARLVAVSTTRVRPILDELAAANLLFEHQPGRFALHDLVYAYARELACASRPTSTPNNERSDSAPARRSNERSRTWSTGGSRTPAGAHASSTPGSTLHRHRAGGLPHVGIGRSE